MKPTVAFLVGEEGLATAGSGIPCWGQAPGELGSAGPGAAPGRPTSPPWAALAVCGSLSLSPQARFSRSPWTFRAGRCAVTPACSFFAEMEVSWLVHMDLFPLVCLHLITWVCCSCSGWPGACQDSTVCGMVLGSCSWRSCRGSAPGRRALTSLAAAPLTLRSPALCCW